MKTKNRHRQFNAQGGYVMILALLGLLILMIFLLTGITTTTTSIKVSGNYGSTIEAFSAAESGIAKGKSIMKSMDFDDALADYTQLGLPLIAPTALGNATYTVTVEDNDDGDGDPYADADNIIIVTSVGEIPGSGRTEIEAYVQKPTTSVTTLPPPSASDHSPVIACGISADIQTKGSSTIDGSDFSLPSLPCSGIACTGINLGLGGGGYAVQAEGALTTSGGGFLSLLGLSVLANVGVDLRCLEWRTLRDQLASLDPSNPDVVVLNGSGTSAVLNSCADPKIFIIDTASSTYKFSGSAELCGVVVVASNTLIEATGNTVIAGLVLSMGPAANLGFVAASGTPRLFGKVVIESNVIDKALELQVKGTADIKFSTEGLAYAQEAINDALGTSGGGSSPVITMAWQEVY